MSNSETTKPTRFSGFFRPRAVGLGPLSLPASLVFIVDMLISSQLFPQVEPHVKIIILVQLVALFVGCAIRNADGQTLWSRTVRRIKGTAYSSTGITDYKAPFHGNREVPSVMSDAVALEYVMDNDKKVMLLHYKGSQQYAIAFKCRPNGGERMSTEDRDERTTNWAGFGNDLAQIESVDQYTVTILNAPSNQPVARKVMEDFIKEGTPPKAQEVTRERLALGTVQHAATETWVSVTFSAIQKGTSDEDRRVNADHIMQLIPTIQHRLALAGAGRSTIVTERDAAEYMKAALNPDSRPYIEDAHAHGEDTGLDWSNCGPMFLRPRHEYLIHDGAVSQTLMLTQPPTGQVPDTILAGLLSPHNDIPVKRVTLVKQVIHPGLAMTLTKRDLGSATNRADNQRLSSTAKRESEIAQRTSDENTEGFALEDFTILVTVTVDDPDKIKRAGLIVRSNLGPAAGCRFTVAYEQQDTFWFYNGPWGLDLHAHSPAHRAQRQMSMTR